MNPPDRCLFPTAEEVFANPSLEAIPAAEPAPLEPVYAQALEEAPARAGSAKPPALFCYAHFAFNHLLSVDLTCSAHGLVKRFLYGYPPPVKDIALAVETTWQAHLRASLAESWPHRQTNSRG